MHIYSAETATVEIPDMEKIENAVRDSRSPYYYPFLLTVTRFFTVKDDKNILFCQTFLLPVM